MTQIYYLYCFLYGFCYETYCDGDADGYDVCANESYVYGNDCDDVCVHPFFPNMIPDLTMKSNLTHHQKNPRSDYSQPVFLFSFHPVP
jgi:hypothetical protein